MLTFHIEFEFRSTLLQSLIGRLFNEAVRRMGCRLRGPCEAALQRPSDATRIA
jgi:hypothetical protein